MRRGAAGYTLIEVIVALAILLFGVVAIVQFFPPSLRASSDAALRSKAALLAQKKVEEIRRDDDAQGSFVAAVRSLNTPTDPIAFPGDDRLAFQYHSRSLLQPQDTPGSPEDDFNVPRVIVRINPQFRPGGDILVELRFDQ